METILNRPKNRLVDPEHCSICNREFTYIKRKVYSNKTGFLLKQRPRNATTCCHECSRKLLLNNSKNAYRLSKDL